jgi:O-antigen ligase
MSLIRITNPKEIRPSHVVMLGLVIVALAGNCFLTSAGKPNALPDGAVEWDPDSLLLAVVEILDLHYAHPTPNGVAIKALVHGVASGLGLIFAAIGIVSLARGKDTLSESDTVIDVERVGAGDEGKRSIATRQLDPIFTAQVLMLLFIVWSFASQFWSHAPEFAKGGAILFATQVVWAFAVAYGLNRQTAKVAGYVLLAVLTVTAGLAALYYDQRNPTLRVSYPIGNALFLAACLTPGVLVAVVTGVGGIQDFSAKRPGRALGKILLALPALALLCYTFDLTKSRGPLIGLVAGLGAMLFFAGGRKIKVTVTVLAIVGMAAVGTWYYSQLDAPSATGRSASMRVRTYAWPYGLDLLRQRPLTGHGQGGYALMADALAAEDVESDPEALSDRVSHAHNEWIEIGSDLGSIGLVLMLGVLVLTLLGGARAVGQVASRAQRWILIALLGSLFALMIEECFGVGLRIEGLPLVYYTVLGLVWALARPIPPRLAFSFARRKWQCVALVAGAVAAGFAIIESARRDFGAARASYDVTVALGNRDWEKATLLAEQAYGDRLSPQRRLTTLLWKIETHVNIAEELQAEYIRRRQAAESPTQPDSGMLERALESRQGSEAQAVAALEGFRTYRATSPSELNSGLLEFRLQSLLAIFAEMDGNSDAAAAFHLEGVDALSRNVARQPFSAELVFRWVMSDPRMSLSDALDLLARPLRVQRVPGAYLDLLSRMSTLETYPGVMGEKVATARAQVGMKSEAEWTNRWAPETLRLDAAVRFLAGDYGGAAESLRTAATLYDTLARPASLAAASCHAELADTLFFLRPDQGEAAIAEAETALRHAPSSQPGRALINLVIDRLIAYHLSLGSKEHEDHVRERMIRAPRPNMKDEAIDREIAERYVRLAYSVFDRAAADFPERLAAWSKRAMELDPEAPMVWALAADFAIRSGDDAEAVRCINEMIRFEASGEDVMALIDRGLKAMPESENLKVLQAHMLEQIEKMKERHEAPRSAPSAPTAPNG